MSSAISSQVCTWQVKSGRWEWVSGCVVCSGVGGSWADGCDSHVFWDSRGNPWWWQATHNVLFTVWVCSLLVTSECSLATALITAFRGAANWKWNCGWALRHAQATLCGKWYLRTVGCLYAQFVIIFPRRKSQRCIWRFSMCNRQSWMSHPGQRANCALIGLET